MRIGYGYLTAQHHPDDERTDVEIYREAIDVAVEVEEAGFDSVWTSEHHFVDDGYMPSQLPVLAAIAARTSRGSIRRSLRNRGASSPRRFCRWSRRPSRAGGHRRPA